MKHAGYSQFFIIVIVIVLVSLHFHQLGFEPTTLPFIHSYGWSRMKCHLSRSLLASLVDNDTDNTKEKVFLIALIITFGGGAGWGKEHLDYLKSFCGCLRFHSKPKNNDLQSLKRC